MSVLPLLAALMIVRDPGPDANQRAMIARRYGMFIHFGINTFNQTEWSDGTLPVSSYNPKQLDCDGWIRTAKEAGFRHVVLVTKHHDGFCLWPTRQTDYGVTSSPVKTDVVGEVAKACKKYGVKLGFYYSLWDRHEPKHNDKNSQVYVDYMKAQLTELLTGYGPICEVWFDGGWAKPAADWHLPEVYGLIKKLQPHCEVTCNLTIAKRDKPDEFSEPEDQMNGDRVRYWPVDFRTKDPNLVRLDDPKLFSAPDGKLHYLPFEHTICISDRWNWFQKRDVTPARTPDELEELFYWCTSNRNLLLVNIPPDQTGRLRENECRAILQTADQLGIRGGDKPLPRAPINQALGAPAEADSVWSAEYDASKAVDGSLERSRWASRDNAASLTLLPKKPFRFNRVALHEYGEFTSLGDGFSQERKFRVRAFTLDAYRDGKWTTIYTGTTIGAAKIIHFPMVETAARLRLHIIDSSAPPSIYLFSVAKV